MYSNKIVFLLLLYGGTITFVKAKVPNEVISKQESQNTTDEVHISPANYRTISINVRGSRVEQIAVEQEKIKADISSMNLTQNQILEKLSSLEKQISQLLQNAQPTDHKKSSEDVRKTIFEPLRFHTRCGENAQVTNNGQTALRKDTSNVYDSATVLTQRPLRSNELFEVRLDRRVSNWYGNLQIGVTIHSAEELSFPTDMQYENTGTWVMVFSDVYHNAEKIIGSYGQNLGDLKVGDRVGVMRKDDGSLHFYVNGLDQGVAAKDVPADIYGLIDLYALAAEASIVDTLK